MIIVGRLKSPNYDELMQATRVLLRTSTGLLRFRGFIIVWRALVSARDAQ